MADLNALIAQGYQPRAPTSPFTQYAQIQQLQQIDQANELAKYSMAKAQQEDVTRNALNRAYQSNLNLNTGEIDYPGVFKSLAGAGAGASIPGIQKTQFEAKTARTEGQIKDTKLLADKLALLPEAYRLADDPEKYLAVHQFVHADPVIGPYLKSLGATPEKGIASLQNAVQTGKFADLRMQSMQSVTQILEGMKPMTVAASSSVYNPRTGAFTQAPAAPEKVKETDLQSNYKAAMDQGFVGTIFDYERKLKEAGRTPGQPRAEPAPTITSIQDPTNVGQMITVNARDYRGGGVGSLGVIGLSGTGKDAAIVEGERKAASLLQRLQFSQSQLTQALVDDPDAAKPNVFASAVAKLSTPLANTLTPEARQRVESAQLDMLDAALTLGTGAAYTRDQLEGYRSSYFPALGDEPKQVKDKQARLENVISAAKIAAGKAAKLVTEPPKVIPAAGNSDKAADRAAADKIIRGR